MTGTFLKFDTSTGSRIFIRKELIVAALSETPIVVTGGVFVDCNCVLYFAAPLRCVDDEGQPTELWYLNVKNTVEQVEKMLNDPS